MWVSELKSQQPAIHDFLSSAEPRAIAGKETVHFSGVICTDRDHAAFFLPRGIAPGGSAGWKAQITMRSLARYARETENRTGSSPTEGGQASLSALILDIVRDYRENGIYSQRVRISHGTAGKPDWKKTIAGKIPFLTTTGAPVYPDPETTRFMSAQRNPLALIQIETIRHIAERHGWWAGLTVAGTAGLADYPSSGIAPPQRPAAIRRFMQMLFDDRSLALAGLLALYWEQESALADGSFICGVPDFSAVWEAMLRSLVNDSSSSWNSRLPMPGYVYRDGQHVSRKGGVTDIVVEEDNRVTVADAKYYAATDSGNAPGIGDMLKQHFYAESIQALAPGKTIRSCFVFPAEKGEGTLDKAVLFERGASPLPINRQIAECIYVDPVRVMNAYVTRSTDNWLAES